MLEQRLATIFRIIGNENPPRDSVGSRLRVLEHILQKEPELVGVDKFYVINRIHDIQFRRSLCELLDNYSAKYITISLNRGWVLKAADERERICRAIAINAAKNTAVNFGKWTSRYSVILDGDCLFDVDGWVKVEQAMKADTHQYLSIPNKNPDGSLSKLMFAFRNDASKRFDESIPFGENDKFHSGLGALTRVVGHVNCLPTGPDAVEQNQKLRITARNESIKKLLQKIETETPIRTGGHNHYYKTIDSFNFDYSGPYSGVALDAPDQAHIVEVGSWLGKSAIYLATELKGYGKRARIDCVDTWDGGNCVVLQEKVQTDMLELFKQNIKKGGVAHMVNPVREYSVKAAKLYNDKSLDFVWIDAGHSYEEVLEDLRAWYPKVRIGGLIAGHDFAIQHPVSRAGVVKAVFEFFKDKHLEIQPAARAWKHVKYGKNSLELQTRKWV